MKIYLDVNSLTLNFDEPNFLLVQLIDMISKEYPLLKIFNGNSKKVLKFSETIGNSSLSVSTL